MGKARVISVQARQDGRMPLRQYFLTVGSALLILLFATDRVMPRAENNREKSEVRFPVIRIHSELKGPELVVFDTTHSAFARESADNGATAVPPAVVVSDASASSQSDGAMAEADPATLSIGEGDGRSDGDRSRLKPTGQPDLSKRNSAHIDFNRVALPNADIRDAFAQAMSKPAPAGKDKAHHYQK
jgi:hypothetical protein